MNQRKITCLKKSQWMIKVQIIIDKTNEVINNSILKEKMTEMTLETNLELKSKYFPFLFLIKFKFANI